MTSWRIGRLVGISTALLLPLLLILGVSRSRHLSTTTKALKASTNQDSSSFTSLPKLEFFSFFKNVITSSSSRMKVSQTKDRHLSVRYSDPKSIQSKDQNGGISDEQMISSWEEDSSHRTTVATSSSSSRTTTSSSKNRKIPNHQLEHERFTNKLYARNKSILILGGSTSWGSQLESRQTMAYPTLLSKLLGPTWKSFNLSVRASDASYMAQCLQTEIYNHNSIKQQRRQERQRQRPQQQQDTNPLSHLMEIEFDIIVLEYSLNGLEGMELLTKRLVQRYPKATFIYIHLWSFRMSVKNSLTGTKPRDVISVGGGTAGNPTAAAAGTDGDNKDGSEVSSSSPKTFQEMDQIIAQQLKDPKAVWAWDDPMIQDSKQMLRMAKSILDTWIIGSSQPQQGTSPQENGGDNGHSISNEVPSRVFLYELPLPESPHVALQEQWFGPDFHHLSAKGHDMVARELVKMILPTMSKAAMTTNEHKKGTWGAGDQCYTWYETGLVPSSIRIEGGTMKNFVKKEKWALNVGLNFGQPAQIWFPTPLSSLVSSSQESATISATTTDTSTILSTPPSQRLHPVFLWVMSWGPDVYPSTRIDLDVPGYENQSSVLDPLHPDPQQQVYHVTRMAHIGWVGDSSVDPTLEETADEMKKNKEARKVTKGSIVHDTTTASRITIDPIEDKKRPLRVLGIIQCGACWEIEGDKYLSLSTSTTTSDTDNIRTKTSHSRLGGIVPMPKLTLHQEKVQENLVEDANSINNGKVPNDIVVQGVTVDKNQSPKDDHTNSEESTEIKIVSSLDIDTTSTTTGMMTPATDPTSPATTERTENENISATTDTTAAATANNVGMNDPNTSSHTETHIQVDPAIALPVNKEQSSNTIQVDTTVTMNNQNTDVTPMAGTMSIVEGQHQQDPNDQVASLAQPGQGNMEEQSQQQKGFPDVMNLAIQLSQQQENLQEAISLRKLDAMSSVQDRLRQVVIQMEQEQKDGSSSNHQLPHKISMTRLYGEDVGIKGV
jgi:hypothetical protein